MMSFGWEALLGCMVFCSSLRWDFRICIAVVWNLDNFAVFGMVSGRHLGAFSVPFGCLLDAFWNQGRPWGPFWQICEIY